MFLFYYPQIWADYRLKNPDNGHFLDLAHDAACRP
jgi:hypothetical protein